MKVHFLGNGGAFNIGLSYSSFIINNHILIECPPDIIQSLPPNSEDFNKIDTIYISHFHGDHFMGLPFFLINRMFHQIHLPLNIIGPKGIQGKIIDAINISFGEGSTLIDWIHEKINFQEITENNDIKIKNYYIIPFKVNHSMDTYGFIIKNNHANLCYLSDSIWDPSFVPLLEKNRVNGIIFDMNHENNPFSKKKKHMDQGDGINFILPLVEENTVIIGTHIYQAPKQSHPRIKLAEPGKVFYVGESHEC
jgi:ribonuclease BN (tRNA processing enzyme)